MKSDGKGGCLIQTCKCFGNAACSLDDERHNKNSSLVHGVDIVKSYMRSPKDELRKFERILTNEVS